jgi:hypothetical protein
VAQYFATFGGALPKKQNLRARTFFVSLFAFSRSASPKRFGLYFFSFWIPLGRAQPNTRSLPLKDAFYVSV